MSSGTPRRRTRGGSSEDSVGMATPDVVELSALRDNLASVLETIDAMDVGSAEEASLPGAQQRAMDLQKETLTNLASRIEVSGLLAPGQLCCGCL